MLRRVRECVLPSITRDEPIQAWIIDDTGFPKKGSHSVGVTRQYCGQLGKQDNCQVAVSLSVATHQGSLPVAYRLYLPKDWADDPIRRTIAGVPDDVRFQTKPEIALQQMRQALADRVPPAVALMDPAYGNDSKLRAGISELGLNRLEQVRAWRVRLVGRIGDRLLEGALNHITAAGDVGHIARDDLLLEERVGHVDTLGRRRGEEELHQQVVEDQDQDEADPPWPRSHQRVALGRLILRRRPLHIVRTRRSRPWRSRPIHGCRWPAAHRLLSCRGLGVARHLGYLLERNRSTTLFLKREQKIRRLE